MTFPDPIPLGDPVKPTDADFREMAELYELGLLSLAERAEFESAVAAGDPAARDAAARIQAKARADVKGSASNPNSTQVWKAWTATSGGPGDLRFVSRESSPFIPLDIPGISARKLHVDAKANRVTMLVRMEPGTSYPPHRHGGFEECFVLEGDLRVGDAVLRAGDYQVVGEGSVHPIQSTTSGCLLFLSSSLSDQLLP
jgi:mannose-6-phosphate isomerase-like protein (cupin superfamily)